MKTLGILLLVLIFLKCLILYKTNKALPLKELRRRARKNTNKQAQSLYKLLTFQTSLQVFILLVGAASGAALFLLIAQISSWFAAGFILAVSWIVLDDRFTVTPGSWLWKVFSYIAPVLVPVVNFLQPLFSRIADLIGRHTAHSGIYEREDLLDLLDRQKNQIDNGISSEELRAARGALTFGDKLVGDVMTPRKDVTWVNQDESIGPKLMDDLHQTGFTRFPVITRDSKPSNPEAIGTMYLTDLLKNLERSGKVADIMKRDAHFINESHDLEQALHGFLQSGQHLLVAVNNFEEVVGVLTLEDVLSQIVGQKINDEFDRYHDKRAVAGHNPK